MSGEYRKDSVNLSEYLTDKYGNHFIQTTLTCRNSDIEQPREKRYVKSKLWEAMELMNSVGEIRKNINRGFLKVSEEIYWSEVGGNSIKYENIKLPVRSTKLSAGYDCFSPIDFILQPHDEIMVPTGIKAYMQPGEVLLAMPRSGLGFKYYCRLANTIGVIDADYIQSDNEGQIFVKLRNEGGQRDENSYRRCHLSVYVSAILVSRWRLF